jgi:hypothetical protein
MIRIEDLPKVIEYKDKLWSLNVHVTAWNKLCISYHVQEEVKPFDTVFLFSEVIEPGMKKHVLRTDNPEDIVDVKHFPSALNTLKTRLERALETGVVKEVKYK